MVFFVFCFLLVGIAEKRNSYWKQDGETYFAGSWHSQAWNVSKTVGDIHHGSTLQDRHSILKTMTHKDLYIAISKLKWTETPPPPLQYIQYFYYLWGKTELENVFVCFGSLQHTNNNQDIGIWDPMFNCISNRLEGMTF